MPDHSGKPDATNSLADSMFSRQAYLLEALRTLATFTGETKMGCRLKDEPYCVIKNLAHSYAVYRRLYPRKLKRAGSQPLEQLFDRIKAIEEPVWGRKPLKWLQHDPKESRVWKKLRILASEGALFLESLREPKPETPIEHLPPTVVHYRAKRIANPPRRKRPWTTSRASIPTTSTGTPCGRTC
jgi:hypothetical protein